MSKDGNVQVDVNILGDDIWMSQDVMANLYDTTKNNISMHLKNIFEEGELEKDSVVKKFLTTASDGKKYNVLHYCLDAIIAVGGTSIVHPMYVAYSFDLDTGKKFRNKFM